MALNRKLVDGENEYLVIERIEPVFAGKNHLHADMWVGMGTFDEKPMRLVIRNTREVRARFLEAGYVPADILCNVVTTVQITVLTSWEAGYGLQVAEVVPAVETVHSGQERDDGWRLDVVKFGKPEVVGTVATFARIGCEVVWTKDGAGRYVRTWGEFRTVYEGKS